MFVLSVFSFYFLKLVLRIVSENINKHDFYVF